MQSLALTERVRAFLKMQNFQGLPTEGHFPVFALLKVPESHQNKSVNLFKGFFWKQPLIQRKFETGTLVQSIKLQERVSLGHVFF